MTISYSEVANCDAYINRTEDEFLHGDVMASPCTTTLNLVAYRR